MLNSKYDKIGPSYDVTRKADPRIVQLIEKHLSLPKKSTILDVGCGTGNYSIKLSNLGYNCIGIDPSKLMLDKARLRAPNIEWIRAHVEQISLKKESVDGILCMLTIHHWQNLSSAFHHLFKVLKYGGKMIIFTSIPGQMKTYWLNHYFPKMMQQSLLQMPSFTILSEILISAGFQIKKTTPFFIDDEHTDMFLYAGKNRPKLYLDPQIRNGISSFADLANQAELNRGLALLEKDIVSKNIHNIMNNYTSKKGDYLLIDIEKSPQKNQRFTSEDYYEEKGLLTMTKSYHLKRGYCCGNLCKHCPYDYINVD